MNRLKRMGVFSLQRGLILRHPNLVRKLLEGMIVVRAEALFVHDVIEYTADALEFKKTELHATPTQYGVVTTYRKDKKGDNHLVGLRLDEGVPLGGKIEVEGEEA